MLGIPDPPVDASRPPFLLWPENHAALLAFLACGSQWKWTTVTGPKGGRVVRTGLDYPGIRAALEMTGRTVTPQLFADIQTLEAAALDEFARREV